MTQWGDAKEKSSLLVCFEVSIIVVQLIIELY